MSQVTKDLRNWRVLSRIPGAADFRKQREDAKKMMSQCQLWRLME